MKQQIKVLFFLFSALLIEKGMAQYIENDWEERDSWMDVPKIFDLAGVRSGSIVADIGCHEGYLSIHMSRKVGESGKVYAVDVRQDRLDKLDKYLEDRDLNNVETILGDYDNPKLPLESLDTVIVMDTYHEMDDYMAILNHIRRSLKPDGRVVIIEKFKSHMRNKTRSEQMKAHTLSIKYVKSELEKAGFSIIKEVKDLGNWENESNKRIWVLVGIAK
ncbi:class I SAM-dependent methyltransferase [Aquimarina gracilis]|uniref:Class I SAM-dependent methyltransferase n=1 Tax=Aquimarina gracilis TaxID=874422 RepID=A0ABU5ZXC8_9FLAO|nr:class I SAM-dependent methyltransferase [Aquimarina gracilis]MEB3346506.1 class I SAM-dependent methyltransferase [Aquimarina gracilis]